MQKVQKFFRIVGCLGKGIFVSAIMYIMSQVLLLSGMAVIIKNHGGTLEVSAILLVVAIVSIMAFYLFNPSRGFDWNMLRDLLNWHILIEIGVLVAVSKFIEGILMLLQMYFSKTASTPNQTTINQFLAGDTKTLMIFFAVCIAPVFEEIMCRGVFFDYFKSLWDFLNVHIKHVGFLFPALTNSLLFCLLHQGGTIFGYLVYFTIGLMSSWLYYKYDNLFVSILFHSTSNIVAVLL